MSPPTITQQDWDALTREYGKAVGEVLVWRRVAGEHAVTIADLRAQLAALSDRMYRADPEEVA